MQASAGVQGETSDFAGGSTSLADDNGGRIGASNESTEGRTIDAPNADLTFE